MTSEAEIISSKIHISDSLFVIGAAVFTSLLTEGIAITFDPFRHLVVPHLQEA